MKYLSDLLYVDIDTSTFNGSYKTYNVVMTSPSFIGSSYDEDLMYNSVSEEIYTGSVFGNGGIVRVYLNDIIQSYVYDNSYVYDHLTSTKEVTYDCPTGVLFEITVNCNDVEYVLNATPYIMNYYRDAKTVEMNNLQELYIDHVPANYNLLTQRTNVLPRIPRLVTMTDRFWLSGLFATNIGWVSNSATATYLDNVFRIAGRKDEVIDNTNATQLDYKGLIQAFTIKGGAYFDIVNNADEVVFATSNQLDSNSTFGELQSYVPIAKVDTCPAEYYLIWIDRTGAYQCQPFNGRTTLTESLSTSYRENIINTSIPFNKTITNKWKMNSGWLTYDEYKAYESILSSKFLYLYNTQYDEGYEVVLETNSWTEKTKENKDKMFNLQIDVKSARPQKITY